MNVKMLPLVLDIIGEANKKLCSFSIEWLIEKFYRYIKGLEKAEENANRNILV